MAFIFNPEWGPYSDVNDARLNLTRFVDGACDFQTGIVWTANGNIYPLRAPKRDADGIGTVVVFEWNKPPPIPRPPAGERAKIAAFVNKFMAAAGAGMLAYDQGQLLQAKVMRQVLTNIWTTHQDDGLGVLMDFLAVGLTLALLPTGLGALGAAGLIGGVFLLGTDGTAYGLELCGNDDGADSFKSWTEPFRVVATVMTLPDILYNGARLLREVPKLRSLLAVDRNMATRATQLSDRTANAVRAQRAKLIAEKANKRAEKTSKEITRALEFDAPSKLAGVASTALFVRDEKNTDGSLLHQWLSGLRIHSVAVYQ